MATSPRPAPVDEPTLSDPWRALTREIESCQRCPLGRTRTHAVVYRGGARPRVVFVGEAPGRFEDEQGKPFVGRSGRLLDAAIARLGLTPSAFGVINVVKCRPPGNQLLPLAVRECRPFLERQLALLAPRMIVTLGAPALAAMESDAPTITKAAGSLRHGTFGTFFPMVHPASTFRSRRYAERWNADLDRLAALLTGAELETL